MSCHHGAHYWLAGHKDAVESIGHGHGDLCAAQLAEGLGIQDEQEVALILQNQKAKGTAVLGSLPSPRAHPAIAEPPRTHGQEGGTPICPQGSFASGYRAVKWPLAGCEGLQSPQPYRAWKADEPGDVVSAVSRTQH